MLNTMTEKEFQQDLQTETLIDALNMLVNSGEHGTLKDIAGVLEYNYSGLNQIVNGRRNAPPTLIKKFKEIYGNTQKPVDYRDDIIALLKRQVSMLENEIDFIKRELVSRLDTEIAFRQSNHAILKTLQDQIVEHRLALEKDLIPQRVKADIRKAYHVYLEETLTVGK